QNAAARLVFNQPKRAHVTPLLIELHWLPVAARIKFKSFQVTYACLQSAQWFCSHLPKCSCKGKCYTQDAAPVLILAAILHLVLVFRRKCTLVLVTFSHFYPP